jgi:hypothetical protein
MEKVKKPLEVYFEIENVNEQTIKLIRDMVNGSEKHQGVSLHLPFGITQGQKDYILNRIIQYRDSRDLGIVFETLKAGDGSEIINFG